MNRAEPEQRSVRIPHLNAGRVSTHAILAALTVGVCLAMFAWRTELGSVHGLTIILGYLSLVYMVVTLVIGPFKLLKQRRNPVNINIRRDVGIWAAITGCLHVYFGFQIHLGGQIVLYFFRRTDLGAYVPLTNLFGASNYVGLVATFVLVLLLLLSNDFSLRKLKSPGWKLLQRLNYGLFVLVVAHMLGYQSVIVREAAIRNASYVVVIIAVIAQVVGVAIFAARAYFKRAHA